MTWPPVRRRWPPAMPGGIGLPAPGGGRRSCRLLRGLLLLAAGFIAAATPPESLSRNLSPPPAPRPATRFMVNSSTTGTLSDDATSVSDQQPTRQLGTGHGQPPGTAARCNPCSWAIVGGRDRACGQSSSWPSSSVSQSIAGPHLRWRSGPRLRIACPQARCGVGESSRYRRLLHRGTFCGAENRQYGHGGRFSLLMPAGKLVAHPAPGSRWVD